MPLREIDIVLDLDRKQYDYPTLEFIQGDNRSLKANVVVIQNGKPVSLVGYSISFFTLLPHTKEFVFDSDNVEMTNPEQGKFSYTFVDKTTQVPGTYETARFIIKRKGSIELSQMARFSYEVERDPLQGSVEANTWISDFSKLLEAIKDVQNKYDAAIAAINKAILSAQNTQKELKTEMQTLRDEIAKSGYVSKTGDAMSDTLYFDVEEGKAAVNVQYGALNHYIGPVSNGTKVKMYFAKKMGDWKEADSLMITVGSEGAVSQDNRFKLSKLTSSSTYCTGVTPPGYTASKSVINGIEKVSNGTISKKTAFQVSRNGEKATIDGEKIMVNAEVNSNGNMTLQGLTANHFVKVKGKEVVTDPLVNGTDGRVIYYKGVKDWHDLIRIRPSARFSILATDVPTHAPPSGNYFDVDVISRGTTGTIYALEIVTNIQYRKTCFGGVGSEKWTAWKVIGGEETEWIKPTLASGWSVLSETYAPKYKKKDGFVYCEGVALPKGQIKGTIFTFPAGFRPAERKGRIVPHATTQNGAAATLYIQPNGIVELVNSCNDTGIWLSFSFPLDA